MTNTYREVVAYACRREASPGFGANPTGVRRILEQRAKRLLYVNQRTRVLVTSLDKILRKELNNEVPLTGTKDGHGSF
jgi:hypothetical protein